MELFQQVIDYFGLPLISEATTFPQLIGALFISIFSIYLVVLIFKVIFGFMSQVNRLMER